jgi:hypothetical protein
LGKVSRAAFLCPQTDDSGGGTPQSKKHRFNFSNNIIIISKKFKNRKEKDTMPKVKKTAADMREEIAETEIELRQSEHYIKQLMRENSKLTRKARNSRLIQRGLLVESMIKEADTLTNEQIKRLLQTAFKSAEVREMAVAFRKENAERQAENAD